MAILNDPVLKSERATIEVARSGVLQATLLPNPVASLSYGALISGPGTTSSVSASLSEDIVAIITREARVKSAEAHLDQVRTDQVWREWQVAQKARQLAVDIYSANAAIAVTQSEHQLFLQEVEQVRKAIAAGNLTLAALSPLAAASAAAEQSLITLRLELLKNWQALDALLGLDPRVRFTIVTPVLLPLPDNLDALIADLPEASFRLL